ncbi:MAG TPA: GntR family transcriptional regulator [Candidatus Dietzia intestinigallinarum]|nr:GntR family transcriptional regulator [Candidatus Dietzia intestinigallinarum]
MSEAGSGSRVGGIVLALDPDSTEPPFRQLKGQIVEAIRRGTLTPGTRMPAIRTLATDVGVAARTAAKVYSELEEAGMLEGRGRSGTFVTAPDLTSAVLTRAAEEFAERASGSGFTLDEALAAVRVAYSHLD